MGMVMEYVSGQSLRSYLRSGGGRHCVPDGEARVLMKGLLSGLSALHGLDFPMVHRDVKPDNVMLRASAGVDDADRVVLVDFGLSKRRGMDQTITVGNKFLGTLHYMSPEQAGAEKDLDVRADVWAAGVVFFEMLAGRRPFEDFDQLGVLEQIKNTEIRPEVHLRASGNAIVMFLKKALARQRDDRFGDAGAMLSLFQKVCAGGPDDFHPELVMKRSSKRETEGRVEELRADPQAALAKRAGFDQSSVGKYGIAVFLAMGGSEAEVHLEGQTISDIFQSRWNPFRTPALHPHSTMDTLMKGVASFENVVIVHMSGHSIHGAMALEGRKVATRLRPNFSKVVLNDSVVTFLTAKGTVELVLPLKTKPKPLNHVPIYTKPRCP